MDCEKCINEQRILALEEDKKRNSEQHKEYYEQLKEIAICDGRKEERENARDRQIGTIMQGIGELKAIITELQNRPVEQVNKIWDKIIDKIVSGIFLAVIGYFMFLFK